MKKLLLLIALLSAVGCGKKAVTTTVNPCPDTVYVHTVHTDTVFQVKMVTVIPSEYLEYKLIVLSVKHYVDITEARPANKTYFYGWIRRAVDGVPELIKRDEQKYGQ